MKDLFPGHYRPTEQEFKELWKECTFAFDANVLLNLYRYNRETSDRLLGQLRKLRARIWLPYQAAKEYQDQRRSVIAKQAAEYDEVVELLKSAAAKLQGALEQHQRHSLIDAKSLAATLSDAFKAAVATVEAARKDHPDFSNEDRIRDALSDLFNGPSVGAKPESTKHHQTAEKRLKEGRPPGLRDSGKTGSKPLGDAVIWLELLEFAKQTRRPLVFVTDDRKDDWWQEVQGKTIGPLPELVEEMDEMASARFYMYRPDAFMERAAQFLNEGSADAAVEEVRRVRDAARDFASGSAFRNSLLHELAHMSAEERLKYLRTVFPELEKAHSSAPADKFSTMYPSMLDYWVDPSRVAGEAGLLRAGERLGSASQAYLDSLLTDSADRFVQAEARSAARTYLRELLGLGVPDPGVSKDERRTGSEEPDRDANAKDEG